MNGSVMNVVYQERVC